MNFLALIAPRARARGAFFAGALGFAAALRFVVVDFALGGDLAFGFAFDGDFRFDLLAGSSLRFTVNSKSGGTVPYPPR
jgi:hypothetical protein